MRRYAQVIQPRAQDEAEYIRYHAAVWPTVLQTISDCWIRNYSIFQRNGVLFAYFEYHGDDYAAYVRKMAACPETLRRALAPESTGSNKGDWMACSPWLVRLRKG